MNGCECQNTTMLQQVKSTEEQQKKIQEIVSEKYWNFTKLFEESTDDHALSEHQPWDHAIDLIEGEVSKKFPIYQLESAELKKLWEQLDKNLSREFVWPSKSTAEYSVIFVSKKCKAKWMCVLQINKNLPCHKIKKYPVSTWLHYQIKTQWLRESSDE